MLKKISFSLLTLFIYNISLANTPKIPQQLQQNVSTVVIDDNTGNVVYSHKADTPRLVASNMKLVTAAVALNQLHPDFRWLTRLVYTGNIHEQTLDGNLYIVGGGDPTFDSNALHEILSHLHGIKKINGNIIIDDTIFNSLTKYSMLKVENYDVDTVLPHGFIVDGDSVNFTIHVDGKKVTIDNNLYGYIINNNLKVDKSLTTCPDLSHQISLQDNTVTFSGTVATSCNNITLQFNMLTHADYTKMEITRTLHDLSIKLNGNIEFNPAPTQAFLLYDYKSQSLEDTLIYMNHFSINLIADATLLSLGAYTTSNSNTYAQGLACYSGYMKENNLLNTKFKPENGSGLSRVEYMTANNMAHLLYIMSHSALSDNFEVTLPQAGESGTLQNVFTQFGKRVHFKTGTLSDTRAYSGYYYTPGNHKYIVVVVANHIDTNNPKSRVVLNNWVAKLLTYLDKRNPE